MHAGRDLLVASRFVEQITGELLDDKLVEGLIAIERVDDPIAVPPRVGAHVVSLVTERVGVTGEVQPMPAPTFTEMLRRQ